MIIDVATKRCTKCGEAKEIGRFGRDSNSPDLLAYWCKDCLNANSRKYHAANRDKVLQRHRTWLAANPPNRAAVANRTRLWIKDNPEQARALAKNGKHRRRDRSRGGMTAVELREWEIAQPKECHWCGAECDSYEIDHRVPLAKGGKHERRNLVISCSPCNRRKGARCPVEFAQSLGRLV